MADPMAQWETIAAEVRTLHGGPGSTIEPQRGSPTTASIPTLEAAADAARLELGSVLGEGGMGVVRLATQRTMGRAVAVKTLRPALRRPDSTRKLLQEAWTTGRLEHPNIVPIYDIAVDGEGVPLIVLKRIEGESWASLLRNPDRAAQLVDGRDALDRNLHVLSQVCRALHFAHSRGVIHLDIKPDNVMLGPHGEVYLVDWGIAMSLADDGTGQLPLAAEHRGIVGTPHYLAPEMLEGDGRKLDARTDVYLLGATLYELVAGHPPHQGETTMAVLHAAMMEEPAFPEDAPAELVAICRRAMHRDPGKRFASADALRRALQDYERHRESSRIAELAAERLDELERAGADASALTERDRHASFAQARFGFEQALASWPDNEEARRGLARTFEVMVQLELEHGDPQVSAALAREAPQLPAELRVRVDAAVARRQANLDELERRRRDQDLRIGQRTRAFVTLMLGTLWTVLPAIEHVIDYPRSRTADYVVGALVPGLSAVLLAGLVVWARQSLTATHANRTVIVSLFLALLGHVVLMFGFHGLGHPVEHAMTAVLMMWAAIAAMVVMTVERRAYPVPIVYTLGFLVAARRPADVYLVIAVCDLVFAVGVSVLWWPSRLRGPMPPLDHRG